MAAIRYLVTKHHLWRHWEARSDYCFSPFPLSPLLVCHPLYPFFSHTLQIWAHSIKALLSTSQNVVLKKMRGGGIGFLIFHQ